MWFLELALALQGIHVEVRTAKPCFPGLVACAACLAAFQGRHLVQGICSPAFMILHDAQHRTFSTRIRA